MILTDTGPLVALINRNDPNHTVCVTTTTRLPAAPLLTTWPCLTEAMYLLYQASGYPAQAALWQMQKTGRLVLPDLHGDALDRMATLMAQYQDRPMDLADASLIVAAERLGARRTSRWIALLHLLPSRWCHAALCAVASPHARWSRSRRGSG